jgi:hypothetical protein
MISRFNPNRSMIHPAANPKSGSTSVFPKKFPEVTCSRDQPNSLTMKS